jgi:hypothetical protein
MAETPAKTDVMFLFDTSGSMGSELTEATAKIVEVMEHTKATLPDVQFAVSEVRDYGPSPYDAETEFPWRLDVPLTPETAKVKEATEKLAAFGGGDSPESYGRALWESDTNPNVGWRAGARHVIVLVADNVPHDNNLNEGIPESKWVSPSPWNTGEELPGTWNIAGTVWTSGTNMDFQSTMGKLGHDGKPLEEVEFFGEETGYLPYWEYWASLAGGVALPGKSGELAARLSSLIEKGATTSLPPCPSGQVRNGEGVCVHATSTQVICNLVIATASDTCTATVGDAASESPTNPTGTVTFTSSNGGVFSAGNTCNLTPTPMSGNTSSCSVQFLPPSEPSTLPAITASYGGDATHAPSSGQTHYGPASELAIHLSLAGIGTITPGGTVEVPVACEFPCVVVGELLTLPGLAKLTSLDGADAGALAAKHKKKHKPVLLGKGTLKLGSAGKGKLIVKLSRKGKNALSHVTSHGVHLTLKIRATTLGGTLVAVKQQGITVRPSKHKKHHH